MPRSGAFLLLGALLLLTGCVSAPPRTPDNLCAIFDEKRGWYADARDAQQKWGLPIAVGMAFVHKESAYVARARPPRGRLLWVIPWRRPSSAYGYAQATNEAWADYRRDTGRWFVDRDDFGDSMDFIGWYNHRSSRLLGISLHDPYRLYLAYYSGPTGYRTGVWRRDARIQGYARRVADRAGRYGAQLARCEDDLGRGFWNWFG